MKALAEVLMSYKLEYSMVYRSSITIQLSKPDNNRYAYYTTFARLRPFPFLFTFNRYRGGISAICAEIDQKKTRGDNITPGMQIPATFFPTKSNPAAHFHRFGDSAHRNKICRCAHIDVVGLTLLKHIVDSGKG